jgi:beta-phosphoglucomutase-like phosphatase (HAD superfamily)
LLAVEDLSATRCTGSTCDHGKVVEDAPVGIAATRAARMAVIAYAATHAAATLVGAGAG